MALGACCSTSLGPSPWGLFLWGRALTLAWILWGRMLACLGFPCTAVERLYVGCCPVAFGACKQGLCRLPGALMRLRWHSLGAFVVGLADWLLVCTAFGVTGALVVGGQLRSVTNMLWGSF